MSVLTEARKTVYPYPCYEAHFSDGTIKRMSFYSKNTNRLLDVESGRRLLRICNPDKTLSTGFVEYNGHRWADDGTPINWRKMSLEPRKPKTQPRAYRSTLRDLIDYLEGRSNDASVVDRAKEIVAA